MAEYEDVLTNQPVVIDNVCSTCSPSRLRAHLAPQGSGTIKAGFAGQDHPKCFFPSLYVTTLFLHATPRITSCCSVGRPKHVRVMAGALEGDVFIGRRAQEFRGLLKIKYPMEHGIVTDWDDMERIWGWIYAEELGTLSEEVGSTLAHPRTMSIVFLAAPRALDRSTAESSQQSRRRCSDLL